MPKLSWRAILLSGLVVGMFVNVGEALLLLEVDPTVMQALPDEAARILDAEAGSAPFYLGYGFVVGVVAMWLYSALAPRYGSGWKPAAYVGVALFSLYEAKYIILDVFFVQQPLITVGFNVAVMLAACVGGMIAGARLGEVVG